MSRILFVTGTDTGVGKTLLAALLVRNLRQKGLCALAMKPFCTGDRSDVELLGEAIDGELSQEEINPFYFNEPVAPLVAARKEKRMISLQTVLDRISEVQTRSQCLIIEGCGGLLTPLCPGVFVVDLILQLSCEVVVVAANRLGTINHTLLTVKMLQSNGLSRIRVALMTPGDADRSVLSNREVIEKFLQPIRIVELPFLGRNANKIEVIKGKHKNIKKPLALLANWSRFPIRYSRAAKEGGSGKRES